MHLRATLRPVLTALLVGRGAVAWHRLRHSVLFAVLREQLDWNECCTYAVRAGGVLCHVGCVQLGISTDRPTRSEHSTRMHTHSAAASSFHLSALARYSRSAVWFLWSSSISRGQAGVVAWLSSPSPLCRLSSSQPSSPYQRRVSLHPAAIFEDEAHRADDEECQVHGGDRRLQDGQLTTANISTHLREHFSAAAASLSLLPFAGWSVRCWI